MVPKHQREAVIFQNQSGLPASRISKLTKTPRSTIYSIIRRYNELGSTADRQISGRPSVFQDKKLQKRVRQMLYRNPEHSGRKLAQTLRVDKETLRRYIRGKLCMKPFKKQKVQLLTEINKKKQVQRSRQLLKRFNQSSLQRIVFF
jgi:hypothetical protein